MSAKTMMPPRVAMVFAHPGHEILVAGMIQRYRPQMCFLTRSDSGGDAQREELARAGLRRFGLEGHATFFGLSEVQSYTWALAGQLSPYVRLRDRLVDWLCTVRPTVVFGDAFELSNFHHDLCRALLDSALRIYCEEQGQVDNCECPLVCRTAPELWHLRLQEFPFGSFDVFDLSAEEVARKQDLVEWAGKQRTEVAMARSLFPSLDREAFRAVPWDRDYSVVPTGLQKHYDEWGQFQVRLGNHEQPVLFAEHFIPIVHALGLTTNHLWAQVA